MTDESKLPPFWVHQPGPFNRAQTTQLLEPINPVRVHERGGRLNVVAADIRAHFNRVFGFGGWSGDLVEPPREEFVRRYRKRTETDATGDAASGQEMIHVGYLATYRLTVYAWAYQDDDNVPTRITVATYTESAIGDASMGAANEGDARDFAVKTAESQAMKRCAINLGDQFGLSLYREGEAAWKRIVGSVLVGHQFPEEQAPTLGSVEPTEQVQPEDAAPPEPGEMPTELTENDWVGAAAAAETEEAWDRLFNAARAARQPQKVLDAMKRAKSYDQGR